MFPFSLMNNNRHPLRDWWHIFAEGDGSTLSTFNAKHNRWRWRWRRRRLRQRRALVIERRCGRGWWWWAAEKVMRYTYIYIVFHYTYTRLQTILGWTSAILFRNYQVHLTQAFILLYSYILKVSKKFPPTMLRWLIYSNKLKTYLIKSGGLGWLADWLAD